VERGGFKAGLGKGGRDTGDAGGQLRFAAGWVIEGHDAAAGGQGPGFIAAVSAGVGIGEVFFCFAAEGVVFEGGDQIAGGLGAAFDLHVLKGAAKAVKVLDVHHHFAGLFGGQVGAGGKGLAGGIGEDVVLIGA
ncbi:hypothetical protein DDR33_25335, partial [Pararcticibacter amylolyticus]